MWFLRLLLVLAGTAVGFVLGGSLTQDATGALALGFVALLLMVLITKRRRPREVQVAATPLAPPVATEPAPQPKKTSIFGRVVKTFFALVGVSGVIAVLKHIEDEKDRDRDRLEWSEQQYREREKQLTQQMASMSGRVFVAGGTAPVANASVGFMAGPKFVPLAQTAPDGSFRIDRPFSPNDYYPIQIAVVSPRSGGRPHVTQQYLRLGQDRQRVVIYVFN